MVQIVQSEAYLLNIMISHEKRRHGYGKTLLQKIMRWLKESGVNKLVLDVDPENLPAVFLYKKVGFHTLARRTKSYPNGEDSLLMNKDL